MTVYRQPGYSEIIASHFLPELEAKLYNPRKTYIENTLERICLDHAAKSHSYQAFYFKGRFYSNPKQRVYVGNTIRPDHTVHPDLMTDMMKLVEIMEDMTFEDERDKVISSCRMMARKAANIGVLSEVLPASLHTDIINSYRHPQPISVEESDLVYNLKIKYEDVINIMIQRLAMNMFMTGGGVA